MLLKAPGVLTDLKIALRNIRGNKHISLISIFGLAFGLACCLLLVLWIGDELSYDRFHANADRICRLEFSELEDGQEVRHAHTPAPVAPAFLAEYPEIERAVRIGSNGFQVSYNQRQFSERVFFADPEIFEVFTFPLVKGDPHSALARPDGLLLSESMSRKYFGEEDPIGKTLSFLEYKDFTVTGVFKDVPRPSHLHFDFLGQFAACFKRSLDQWGVYNYTTYLLVGRNFDENAFLAKTPAFIQEHLPLIRPEFKFRYLLRPLTKIHLTGHARGEIEANGNLANIVIFSAVALIILLIAGFNYVNFATAQYASRRREVGIRKAVGAGRRQIALQFLRESLIMAFIALVLAWVMAATLLPLFGSLVGKDFPRNALFRPGFLAAAVLLGALAGLLAGSYPAVYLSSAAPALVLRGKSDGRPRGAALRNSLIVAQFAVSAIFLIGTIVITRQMDYIRTKKLGLDKSGVVVLPVQDTTALGRMETLKAEIGRVPGVESVAASAFKPGQSVYHQNYWREGMGADEFPMIAWIPADPDFIKTLGIVFAAGRDFSPEFAADSGKTYILNEAAVKELGWASPQAALGQAFKIVEKGTIVGVVQDFHFDSLHKTVEPLALYVYPSAFDTLYVRISVDRVAAALAGLKTALARLAPRQDFAYAFLDDEFERLYKTEVRLGQILKAATAGAIIIAILGLLGLTALIARFRTKEIGIRKVVGASTRDIVFQFMKELGGWIVAANLIAWPVAYAVMNRWLRNFAFRTSIRPWIFLAAGALVFGVSILAVGWQSVKTARADPAEALRHE
jgi:putative ABC transport system permease protein